MGTEVAAAVADRETRNRSAAVNTGLPTAVGNLKFLVGGAPRAIGTKVSIGAGSFTLDAGPQYLTDGTMEAFYFLRR